MKLFIPILTTLITTVLNLFYGLCALFVISWFMSNLILGCNDWSNEEVCITPVAFIEEII